MPDDRSLRARTLALASGAVDVLRGVTFGRHLNRDAPGASSDRDADRDR